MAGRRISPWMLIVILAVIVLLWFGLNYLSVRA
jgi:hypothetical protein